MSGDEPHPEAGDVFDVERIRLLVQLMEQHDLSQIDLRHGSQRIRLRRGGELTMPVPVPSPAPLAYTAPAAASSAAAASGPGGSAPADEANIAYIRSPMVGTFYSRPNPDAEPFVKVGDIVSPETTVCVIEAMKVFNEIPAEVSGRVVAVLVDNEEPVEFGKPLFKVELSS